MSLKFLMRKVLLLFFVTTFTEISFAQVEITFPAERSVFQRRNNNTGYIPVSGLVFQEVDRVEARLVPRIIGQGLETSWQTIDASVDGRAFNGRIEGTAGWYRLEIRSIINGNPVFINIRERIGIGEVFVIAGQSNAQGEGDFPNPSSATDDRVNCYQPNFYNKSTALFENFPNLLEYDKFAKLEALTNIGPTGYTAYYWGELGDKLAAKLNVPIMFFNVALSATSTENWVVSMFDGDTYSSSSGKQIQRGFPYKAMRQVLNQIIPTYGMRAVLWHQGEQDARDRQSENNTFNNLAAIISQSRQNIGENIPWVIAKVSRFFSSSYPPVLAAQNRAITQLQNVWPGPETDPIQPTRYDGAHFNNTSFDRGLTAVANAWNNSLSSSFFSTYNPLLPKGQLDLKYTCVGNNSAEFRVDGSYSSFLWNNGSTVPRYTTSNEDISIRVTENGTNNVLYSNRVLASFINPEKGPNVSGQTGLVGCVGKTLVIITSPSRHGVLWNTGATSANILINGNGSFSAKYKSSQGCFSPESNTVNTNFVNPPAKPNIAVINSAPFICDGGTITLRVNNPQNNQVIWSNGEKTNEISIKTRQKSPLTVSLSNGTECTSIPSDSLKYGFIENPSSPRIEPSGPYSLKVLSPDKNLNSYQWFIDNKLAFENSTPEISSEKDGFYSVKTVKSFEYESGKLTKCISPSSGLIAIKNIDDPQFGLRAYPNPNLDGKLYISSSVNIEDVKIEAFDLIGRRIYVKTLKTLNLPELIDLTAEKPKGTIILKVSTKGVYRTFPIVFE
jgi:cyclophilin family peptidyl-prolyl cis-trans isomerase